MNQDFIAKHWYASVYEQFETQTDDVDFLLNTLKAQTDGSPQKILEVACGGGRICVPLAMAGHEVTGFDADEQMLLRCVRRGEGLKNLRVYQAEATTADWGGGYDVVVLGGNLLINIESTMDYAQAQQLFLRKAAMALRPGGHLWLDFDLHADPAKVFHRLRESSYFEGVDELGTTGRVVSFGSVYNPVTQICTGANHVELTTCSGQRLIIPEVWHKHIPTLSQVLVWLADAGLVVEQAMKNFTPEPLAEPLGNDTWRATIWACKQ